jgi:glycosyltransferase involved in cell wall biosynthesis
MKVCSPANVLYLEPLLTPYRIPLFNRMAERFARFQVCFQGFPGLHWNRFLNEFGFDYTVIKSRQLRLPGTQWVLDPDLSVWRYLWKRRPEAIILSGYSTLASLWVVLYARRSNTPLVMFSASHPATVAVRSAMVEQYRRLIVSMTDAYAVPSQASKKLIVSVGGPAEAIFWTPNAIDNTLFWQRVQATQPEALKRKAALGLQDRHVLLFVGRLAPEKGIDVLIEAFAQSKAAREERLALLIVGDGPQRTDLAARSRHLGLPNVLFMGFAEQDELLLYYGLAHGFVLPSVRETWGMVVNEAMACGLPVIISDACGAANEAVQDGVNGYVVPTGDVHSLAQTIDRLFADETLRRQMAQQSRGLIERYTVDAAVDGFVAAIQFASQKRSQS